MAKTSTKKQAKKQQTKRKAAANTNGRSKSKEAPASEIRLFPHVLVRVAGGPFEELEKLSAPKSCELLEEIAARENELTKEKEALCDELHKLIGAAAKMKTKRDLINLRRDLFNERPLKMGDLPGPLRSRFSDYLKEQAEINSLQKKGETIFENELSESRKQLRKLAQNETLRKGLILSSQSLLKRLDKYLETPDDKLGKSERNTEKSLLKYITRMYAKTSPFSTFTNLAMAELSDDLPGGQLYSSETIDGQKPEVVSHIRLNNFLFQYLKGLLTKHAEIRRHFLLRPNPTLRNNGKEYLFLTNSNNVEAFQRIPANPVLEVFQHIASEKKSGVSLRNMIKTILENEYIDAPAEELEAYIIQLLEYGFLEYNLGCSGTDPDWDKKLRTVLGPIAKEITLVAELNSVLASVRKYSEAYGTATVEKRQEILIKAHKQFRSVCMKIHEDAGLPEEERKMPEELAAEARQKYKEEKAKAKARNEQTEADPEQTAEEAQKDKEFKHESSTFFHFKPEQMFYEDTALEVQPRLKDVHFKSLVLSLHRALQGMKLFEGRLEEKDRMLHFFRKKYGNEPGGVELLRFYEDYYREVKKPQEEKEAEKLKAQWEAQQDQKPGKKEKPKNKKIAEKEIFPVPGIQMRVQQRQRWLKRFQATLKKSTNGVQNSEQIKLFFDQVNRANANESNGGEPAQNGNSFGMFMQFYQQPGEDGEAKLMGVLNASLAGFGKMLSRFLHIYERATDDTRKWNLALAGDKLFLEDTDASYFNANLHPPLMPSEIWVPGGHNSLSPEQQVPVTDLQLSIDTGNSQLQLKHKATNQQMHVFDLGFQGHLGRSPLYRLLESFTKADYLGSYPLINGVNQFLSNGSKNKDAKSVSKIRLHPRIVYEEQIVLRRKTWFVPKPLLPFKEAGESDWHYFSRVNRWRLANGIPDEVFVFVNPNRDNQNAAAENPDAYKKLGRDDYKPQYLCFKNPLLLIQFEKMLHRVPEVLKIEEMLPGSQELLKMSADRRVTESVVQWYTNLDGDALK